MYVLILKNGFEAKHKKIDMQRDFSVISLFSQSGFVSFTWEELPIHGRCFVTLQSWIMVCLLWAMVSVSI